MSLKHLKLEILSCDDAETAKVTFHSLTRKLRVVVLFTQVA